MKTKTLALGSLVCLMVAACSGAAGQRPVPATSTPMRAEVSPSETASAPRPVNTPAQISSPSPVFEFTDTLQLPTKTATRSTDTSTPTPRPSATPEPVPDTESPTPTFYIPPTALPTINPVELDGLLKSNLNACPFECDNGKAYRIAGWAYGFRSSGYCADGPYRWMDQKHLLLFPLTGEEEGPGMVEWTRPVVVTLKTKEFWLPPVNGPAAGCDLPVWSSALRRLVTYDGEKVLALKPDGRAAASFSGTHPLALSPSGNRLLAGNTWIDLKSGQIVAFTRWSGTISTVYPPAWSSDERRVYTCCFSYGDAATGGGESFDFSGVLPVGRGLEPGFPGIPSYWVLNDSYALTQWDFFTAIDFGIMPLVDPLAKNFYDLRTITGIRSDAYCKIQSISPDKKHAWISCQDDSFWLDFSSFGTLAFPPSVYVVSWSADGSFALIGSQDDPSIQVLTANDASAQLLPASVRSPTWNPKDHVLAYFSEEGQSLNVQNLDTQVLRQVRLPGEFSAAAWNPGGDALALQAADGSIWLAFYPSLDGVAQLAPPAPGVRDIRWSPDGDYLAYVSGQDILIIKTP